MESKKKYPLYLSKNSTAIKIISDKDAIAVEVRDRNIVAIECIFNCPEYVRLVILGHNNGTKKYYDELYAKAQKIINKKNKKV